GATGGQDPAARRRGGVAAQRPRRVARPRAGGLGARRAADEGEPTTPPNSRLRSTRTRHLEKGHLVIATESAASASQVGLGVAVALASAVAYNAGYLLEKRALSAMPRLEPRPVALL